MYSSINGTENIVFSICRGPCSSEGCKSLLNIFEGQDFSAFLNPMLDIMQHANQSSEMKYMLEGQRPEHIFIMDNPTHPLINGNRDYDHGKAKGNASLGECPITRLPRTELYCICTWNGGFIYSAMGRLVNNVSSICKGPSPIEFQSVKGVVHLYHG